MLNSLINNIPLVKEVINVIFNKTLGFNIDLEQINVDKGIGLNFNNIDLDPYMLNQLIFSGENQAIKLRIAKISIKSFSIALTANQYCINVNGLDVVIMPITQMSNSSKKHLETHVNKCNKNNPQQEGLMDSILTFFLSRIEVKMENISVHLLNIETTRENILFANPCLTLKIGTVNYTKGVCDIEKETTSIFGNKKISVENIYLMVEKNYRENLDNDPHSDKERDNGIILSIENEKGITVYSNYSNDIAIEIGVIQVIINPLQLELIRNIVTTYSKLFASNCKQSSLLNTEEEEKDTTPKTTGNFNLKLHCSGMSLIQLENNYRSDLPKYFLFETSKAKLTEHFCYFEDNFYLLSLSDLTMTLQDKCIKSSIENFQLIFIEYEYKTLKEPGAVPSIPSKEVNKSVYEDAESFICQSKDKDSYQSVHTSTYTYLEKLINSYLFKYISYDVIAIANFQIELENINNIAISIKSLKLNIHPIYMFKILKATYSNAIILNELLLYNLNQKKKKTDPGEQFNHYIKENGEIDYINIDPCIHHNSEKTNNFQPNPISKPQTQSINLKLNIGEIDVIIQSFKREKDFETIATPYFAEFYYDSIYLMNKKYNAKKCLDISLITSDNSVSLSFRKLSLTYNSSGTNLKLESFDTFFNKKQLIHSVEPWEIDYSESILDINKCKDLSNDSIEVIKKKKCMIVNIKTCLTCTLSVWQLQDMMTFLEVWTVTMSIFEIFQNQMETNHNKIRSDIDSIYSIPSKTNKHEKTEQDGNSHSVESHPIFFSLSISNIDFNIKTYYDTDSLITSLNNIQTKLLLSNNCDNIDFFISLGQIQSRKLFSSDQISFYFNLKQKNDSKEIHKSIIARDNEIQPEQDFEFFIIQSKALLKKKNSQGLISKSKTIFFKLTANHLNFQPINLISLFVAVLPQIQNNKSLMKKSIQNTSEDCMTFGISSSNLINDFPANNSPVVNFEIEIHEITFDYMKSPTCLIIAFKDLKLSPTSVQLNELRLDLRREICPNSKQSLICTCASICNITFDKNDSENIYLGIGRTDIKFCKDSFWCLIEIITDISTFIAAKVKDILDMIAENEEPEINNNTLNKKSNTKLANTSAMSLNSNFIRPLINLDIEDNYLSTIQPSVNIGNLQGPVDSYENTQLKKLIKITLVLGDVYVALYKGDDFQSEIDYNSSEIEYICSEENDQFILVKSNQFAIKSKRDVTNYILLSLHHFELKSELEVEGFNSATLSFMINTIEIFDNLSTSQFKRIISRKNIDSIENMVNSSITMSNSLNSISAFYYCDYDLTLNFSIQPLSVCIDQTTLSFVLAFFTLNEEISLSLSSNSSMEPEPESFILQPPPQEIKKSFIHLSHHSKIKKEKFIFIKNFYLDEINIDISFQEHTLSTSTNNINIPILSVEQFPFNLNAIKLKGYCHPNDLLSIITEDLLSQIMNSKFKILYQGIRSCNLTKPITSFLEKFIQIFTTPYYSYKDNKGLFQGLVKGVKNFIMNIVSLNFLYGEKTVKTLTAFIGVSKSNQITKKSFYNKYFIDDHQQKLNDYFYKE